MSKILIVEDDTAMAEVMLDSLRAQRFEVDWAENGDAGWTMLLHYKYDLVILDWNLPSKSGPEICKDFRSRGGSTPVIMLTARSQIIDKEKGFDAGADDYLTKPFEMRELFARIRALLRRPSTFVGDTIDFRHISLDSASQTVRLKGQPVKLIPREFSLLHFFLKHPNEIFSIEALQERVWSNDSDALPTAVRKCVERLRKKLDVEGEPTIIDTIYGVGYILRSE
jgi:OmpR-family two-component system manganese-sensing response regulator